jgi:type II secretory pathway pseudopilin PulG
MRLPRRHFKPSAGVTLIEMLLCIGLIAVITSLALPMYSSADGAREAKDRRNAQTICSIAQIIQAAGVPLVEEGKEKMEIIDEVRAGVTVQSGPYQGKTFRVPSLADEEARAAASYLEMRNGQLVYNSQRADG